MRKIEKYVRVLLFALLAGIFFTAKPVQAASAEIEIAADTKEVTAGDDFFVYIRITSDTMFGDFEANLTYDDEQIEYIDGASVITGSSGFLKISDFGLAEGNTNRKYTLKFHAVKPGTVEISFPGRAMVYDFETSDEMSVSSNVLTLEVKAAETASQNAYLKSLKTSPSQLTPEFNKTVYEYSTEVASDVSKLVIDALPEDEKATIKISGNDLLKEGENKIIVTVLAESGDVIEYTIKVMRAVAPESETPEEPTIAPGKSQSLFEVVRLDGEVYAVYSGKYKLVTPGSDVAVPEGFVKGEAILSDISVTAYFPEEFMENRNSDFYLIYAENEFGEKGFYLYDKIEKTLQRYAPENFKGSNAAGTEENESVQAKEYHANLTKAAVVIAILAVLIALLLFAFIRLYMKQKGYKEEDLD